MGWGGVIGRFIVTFSVGKHHDGEQLIMEEIVPEGKSPPWPGGMAAGGLNASWLSAFQHTGSRERLPTPVVHLLKQGSTP